MLPVILSFIGIFCKMCCFFCGFLFCFDSSVFPGRWYLPICVSSGILRACFCGPFPFCVRHHLYLIVYVPLVHYARRVMGTFECVCECIVLLHSPPPPPLREVYCHWMSPCQILYLIQYFNFMRLEYCFSTSSFLMHFSECNVRFGCSRPRFCCIYSL